MLASDEFLCMSSAIPNYILADRRSRAEIPKEVVAAPPPQTSRAVGEALRIPVVQGWRQAHQEFRRRFGIPGLRSTRCTS